MSITDNPHNPHTVHQSSGGMVISEYWHVDEVEDCVNAAQVNGTLVVALEVVVPNQP